MCYRVTSLNKVRTTNAKCDDEEKEEEEEEVERNSRHDSRRNEKRISHRARVQRQRTRKGGNFLRIPTNLPQFKSRFASPRLAYFYRVLALPGPSLAFFSLDRSRISFRCRWEISSLRTFLAYAAPGKSSYLSRSLSLILFFLLPFFLN